MSGSGNKSLAAPIVGLILFILSFPLLWWNEGIAVDDYLTIGDLEDRTVTTSADKVNPDLDGQPVHVIAKAETDQVFRDETFGVEANALRMERQVEMYQWEENRPSKSEKEEGKKTTYQKTWSDAPIDSAEFETVEGHENPPMPYERQDWIVEEATFGAYTLPKAFIQRLDAFEPVNLADIASLLPDAKLIGNGGLYLGDDPSSPQIGDVRIRFRFVLPQEASLIAQQEGSSFVPFKSEKTGNSWIEIAAGSYDKDALIELARGKVKLRTWILRAVGSLIMFFGLMVIISPVRRFMDRVPFLGNIVDAGIVIVNLLLAASLSLIVIIIAWFAHRPMLAIGLAVVTAVLVFLLTKLIASRSKKR